MNAARSGVDWPDKPQPPERPALYWPRLFSGEVSIQRSVWLAAGAAGLVTWACAFWLPRDFGVGNYVDDAHYAVLAKSIRTRGEYRTLNLPGQPPETKYPPGFPLVLAMVWQPDRPDAENLNRTRMVNLVLAGGAAATLTFTGVTLGVGPWLSAGLAAAGMLAPGVATLWTIPMSGTLFLVLVSAGIAAWGHRRRRWALGLMLASVYVRTLGIGFVAMALAAVVRERRADWKPMVAASVLALLPWLGWQAIHGDAVPGSLLGIYGSYGQWYLASLAAEPVTVLTRVPVQNLGIVLGTLAESLAGQGWLPGFFRVAIGGVMVAGLVFTGAKFPLAGGGLAAYFALAVLWPFPPDRFVHAVWPLLLLMLAAVPPPRARGTLLAVAAAVAIVGLLRDAPVAGHRQRSAMSEEVIARLDSVPGLSGPLASTNAGLHYLRLGVETVPGQKMETYKWYRLGFWATAWGQADDLWPIIERYRPSHLVVEPRGVEGRFVAGSLQGLCPDVLRPLWEGDRALLFAVDSGRPCRPDLEGR